MYVPVGAAFVAIDGAVNGYASVLADLPIFAFWKHWRGNFSEAVGNLSQLTAKVGDMSSEVPDRFRQQLHFGRLPSIKAGRRILGTLGLVEQVLAS